MDNTNFQTIHQMGNAINNVVRQAVGRDNVQNIDMDYVTVAQRKREVEETATGNPATFVTNYAGALDYLIAQITPVQDLHGYDNPWPGGGGKNLFDPDSTSHTWVDSQGNVSNTRTLVKTVKIPASEGQRFCLSNDTPATSANVLMIAYFNSGDSLLMRHTVYSGEKYISTTAPANTAYCIAGFYTYTDVVNPMLEIGTSTPTAYAPYSNICPISGWTGANVTVSPTLNEEDGTTYSIVFPSSAGSVYGGTLTVNKDGTGTLVVDRGYKDLGTLSWSKASGNYFYAEVSGIKTVAVSSIPNLICSQYKAETGSNVISGNYNNTIGVSSSQPRVLVCDLRYSDAQTFTTAMDGVQLVYELATPVEIDLTELEVIETLLGTNNIWADTGDITVMYKNYEEVI